MGTRSVGFLWLALHGMTTVRLVLGLLRDGRVNAGLKLLFLALVGAVGLAEVAPDIGLEMGSWLLPGIGPLLGLGADAALDWTLLIPVIAAFIRLAPQDVVAEHLERLRGRRASAARPVVEGEFRAI